MKYVLFFFFIISSLSAQWPVTFTENGKTGYMNNKGTVIIPAKYYNGFDFSDGVAAVRENGYYGFIDINGNYVIKPQYDFAKGFEKGYSLVYKNGKPSIIDKRGKPVFNNRYTNVYLATPSKFIATTHDNRQQLIDSNTGKIFTKQEFSQIGKFYNGVAICYLPKKKHGLQRVCIIDTLGNTIIPEGKYQEINNFSDNVAIATKPKGDAKDIIDTKGNILFTYKEKNNSHIYENFNNGLAVVNLYKYWIPEKENTSFTSEKMYDGYINKKGEIVLNDTLNKYLKNFSDNRVFLKQDKGYRLVDNHFTTIGDSLYYNAQKGFKNGYAIVENKEGAGIIDTTGQYIVKPVFKEIDEAGIVGNVFFYVEYDTVTYEKKYGIANLQGKIISKAVIENLDATGYHNGIIKVMIDGRLTYLNEEGSSIWQEKKKGIPAQPLNIDYINRGYFYAASCPATKESKDMAPIKDTVRYNYPKHLNPTNYKENSLSVIIDTISPATFYNKTKGYKIVMVNNKKDTVNFSAQDGRLYAKMQALDVDKKWKDIEYLPSSWCGNSYHTLQLPPANYWEFTIPQYDGEIKTKIRAVFYFIDGKEKNKIYSNIINGGVNPGQFYIELDYLPGGLMDPYND